MEGDFYLCGMTDDDWELGWFKVRNNKQQNCVYTNIINVPDNLCTVVVVVVVVVAGIFCSCSCLREKVKRTVWNLDFGRSRQGFIP